MVQHYYEASTAESEAMRELGEMFQDIIPVELSLNLKERLDAADMKIFDPLIESGALKQKLETFEADILKAAGSERVYAIRFYLEPDIQNNAGVITQLSEPQLLKLLNNDIVKVFVLELYDMVQYTKTRQLTYPDWLDQKYVEMLGNKEYNFWHGKLL